MSEIYWQNKVNTLDKEIQNLEKKKAVSDKKAAGLRKRSSNIKINKTASESSIKSKLKQIDRYNNEAIKEETKSADLSLKIASKSAQRNQAYSRLQKEQQANKRRMLKNIENMKQNYESRILNLQSIISEDIVNNIDVSNGKYYDVFISYAFADKESFVDNFVRELESQNVKVWYDETELKWGDSLRSSIDKGLKKSSYAITIISPNYVADNKYWTKNELEGIFQKESITSKFLLPIWHNITKEQVMNYSLMLASRKALITSMFTTEELAEELRKIIYSKENNNGKDGNES